jgi:hypothetical protein
VKVDDDRVRPLTGRLDHIGLDFVAARGLENLATGLCPLLLELADRDSGTLKSHQFSSIAEGATEKATDSKNEDALKKHENLPKEWDVIRLVNSTTIPGM